MLKMLKKNCLINNNTPYAGLVLFLFAVTNLSETLKSALGENANIWIKKYTSNSFISLLVGIVF
jgi:Na+/phosphate symporter